MQVPQLTLLRLKLHDSGAAELPSLVIKDVSIQPASASGAILEQGLVVHLPFDEHWKSKIGREMISGGSTAAVLHGFGQATSPANSPWQSGKLNEAVLFPDAPVRPRPRVKNANISNSTDTWQPPTQWLSLEAHMWDPNADADTDADELLLLGESPLDMLSDHLISDTEILLDETEHKSGSHAARLQMEKPVIQNFGCDMTAPTFTVGWEGKAYYSQYKFHAVVSIKCFKFDGSCPGNIQILVNASEHCHGVQCFRSFPVWLGAK